jgi:LysR family transcriptional regulator, glycine cleavage system transcriptional activator
MKETSRRLLPPMGALQCLDASARLGSFSKAADEVGLTQSAVSRQIAMLEDWLQAPLFERVGRRVRLTSTGREYSESIGPALSRIRSATGAVLERRDDSQLTIATLPSFGMRWLAPRLPGFSALHPDIVVNFTARSVPFDLSETGYDGAIHFGNADWPGAVHAPLFREFVVPVVSPRLMEEAALRHPADLLKVPLLSLQSRRDAWTRWFARAGVLVDTHVQGPVFEHFLMLAQAAAAGAGAALIPRFLIEPELAAGALAVPFDVGMKSDESAYYFVRPDFPPSQALRAFESWILAECSDLERAYS